ncbi:MAG TPA: methyltransferase domain-containing protein [Nitrospira sp.]|nr:methyltransferase domain-containing protein [Nitrospira sp.]
MAEAHGKGIRAVACDPLYGDDISRLIERGEADIQHVIDRVARVPDLFLWNCYSSLDDLRGYRLMALRWFQYDYSRGLQDQRYIKAELPRLPFEDRSFDLVLSGHFLFTYSDRLDYAFHRDAILELFRVSAKEVRIYPLQGPEAQPYSHMDQLLADLRQHGLTAEIRPVPFEFQRGSNQMLRLVR